MCRSAWMVSRSSSIFLSLKAKLGLLRTISALVIPCSTQPMRAYMAGESSSAGEGTSPNSKKVSSTEVSAFFVLAHLPDLVT